MAGRLSRVWTSWGTFQDYLYVDRTLEMPYQMVSIGAIFKTSGYGYGIAFYNSIVKQFVPRGLVGEKFKENFYLPGVQPEEAQEQIYDVSEADYVSGSGIIDSFSEFGFFGRLLFLFTGRIWAWMYHRAIHSRDPRFTLASCLFAGVPPYIMYGGLLSTANRPLSPRSFASSSSTGSRGSGKTRQRGTSLSGGSG